MKQNIKWIKTILDDQKIKLYVKQACVSVQSTSLNIGDEKTNVKLYFSEIE